MNATQTKTEASIAVATRSASRELRLGGTRVGPSPCEVVEERRDGRRCDDKGGDGEHAPEGAIGPEEEERSPGWWRRRKQSRPRKRARMRRCSRRRRARP